MKRLFATFCILSAIAVAQCPVEITKASFSVPNTNDSRVIELTLKYKNVSGKEISNLRYGIQSYTAFDEKFGEATFDTIGKIKAEDKERSYSAQGYRWQFGQPGEGGYKVIFLDKIKFADGTSWSGDGKSCTFRKDAK